MKKHNLKAWGENFTLNNDGGKFNRARQEVGERASPEAFLAAYDKSGGLILDEDKNKVENGIFQKRYSDWKKEQPQYIKTLKEREQALNYGERVAREHILIHIGHKRSFLGTLMTISAAILAGLFILFTNVGLEIELDLLGKIGGLGFALFIIFSSTYLTFLLAQESVSLSKCFRFIRDSKEEFVSKVGTDIVDIESYENYRKQKQVEEAGSKTKGKLLWEGWFIIVVSIFIISLIWISILFFRIIFN